MSRQGDIQRQSHQLDLNQLDNWPGFSGRRFARPQRSHRKAQEPIRLPLGVAKKGVTCVSQVTMVESLAFRKGAAARHQWAMAQRGVSEERGLAEIAQ